MTFSLRGVGAAETFCGGAGCLAYVRGKIISPSRRNKRTNPVDVSRERFRPPLAAPLVACITTQENFQGEQQQFVDSGSRPSSNMDMGVA